MKKLPEVRGEFIKDAIYMLNMQEKIKLFPATSLDTVTFTEKDHKNKYEYVRDSDLKIILLLKEN